MLHGLHVVAAHESGMPGGTCVADLETGHGRDLMLQAILYGVVEVQLVSDSIGIRVIVTHREISSGRRQVGDPVLVSGECPVKSHGK